MNPRFTNPDNFVQTLVWSIFTTRHKNKQKKWKHDCQGEYSIINWTTSTIAERWKPNARIPDQRKSMAVLQSTAILRDFVGGFK